MYPGRGRVTVEDRIFGHDVMQLLMQRGGDMPLEELRSLAAETFGPDTRFWNCHDENFDFDQLLGFLGSKGKLAVQDGVVRLGFVPACGGH
jgi:probable metal-binding protein